MQSSLASKQSRRDGQSPEVRELARQLAGLFHCMANANNRDFLPEISELDLSLTQLKALAALDERAEALSVKELAERLGLSLAATSRSVEGLVKRKLVERDEDLVDRRIRRIGLTARGRRIVERLVAIRVAALERLVASFNDEQRDKLADALVAILENEDVRRFYRPARVTK
jgi:DNA-binding MarR family transcriptional regulator